MNLYTQQDALSWPVHVKNIFHNEDMLALILFAAGAVQFWAGGGVKLRVLPAQCEWLSRSVVWTMLNSSLCVSECVQVPLGYGRFRIHMQVCQWTAFCDWVKGGFGGKVLWYCVCVSGWNNFVRKCASWLQIFDAASSRYEVPIDVPKPGGYRAAQVDYDVKFRSGAFGFTVTRKSSGAILWVDFLPHFLPKVCFLFRWYLILTKSCTVYAHI